MKKLDLLYEGKAKKVYRTDDENLYIVEYKDDATAFNGLKKGTIAGKGVVNNKMSNHIFRLLEKEGIKTHFVEELGERETVVKKVNVLPLEVIIRNVAAGSFSKKYGVAEGAPLACTVLEFCLKDDALGDPMINEYHILALQKATKQELQMISEMAFKINDFMRKYFREIGIELVDFKIEFGKTPDGEIILADEISPDTCRFWDLNSMEKLDKDRFRQDLGKVEEAYMEMLKRIGL